MKAVLKDTLVIFGCLAYGGLLWGGFILLFCGWWNALGGRIGW